MPNERSERIARLEPVIRRIASARLINPSDIDDAVQEVLTRLLEAEDRLELRTLASYAVVTTRNLVTSIQRSRKTEERNAPQLIDPSVPPDPQEVALRGEERDAVLAALANLPEQERQALVERDVLELPTAEIAERHETTPGAASTRLARTRARARVEYLFAFRGLRVTSDKCRPVLYAVAAGEKRRQEELDAGDHIAGCATCGQLVEAVARRSRGLAAIAPIAAAGSGLRAAGRAVRNHPAQSAAAATVAGAAVLAVVAPWKGSPPPPPAVPAKLTIDAADALPLPADLQARARRGARVVARGAPVESVPHDEGFWVGTGSRNRIWVSLRVTGESGPDVMPGGEVWFTGRVARHDGTWVAELGLGVGEGLQLLRSQGFHVVVDASEVRVASR